MKQGESVAPVRQTNAMTLDVEDFFQVAAFEGLIDPARWDSYPLRVDQNTRRVMALFAERGIKATFFLLGWVAERLPQLVRDIAAEGHELANHGYAHARVNSQSREAFRTDIRTELGTMRTEFRSELHKVFGWNLAAFVSMAAVIVAAVRL